MEIRKHIRRRALRLSGLRFLCGGWTYRIQFNDTMSDGFAVRDVEHMYTELSHYFSCIGRPSRHETPRNVRILTNFPATSHTDSGTPLYYSAYTVYIELRQPDIRRRGDNEVSSRPLGVAMFDTGWREAAMKKFNNKPIYDCSPGEV